MMVQMYWQLKLTAHENMHIRWCRKDVEQLHLFDWCGFSLSLSDELVGG